MEVNNISKTADVFLISVGLSKCPVSNSCEQYCEFLFLLQLCWVYIKRLQNAGDLELHACDPPEEHVNPWDYCMVIGLTSCLSIGAQHEESTVIANN